MKYKLEDNLSTYESPTHVCIPYTSSHCFHIWLQFLFLFRDSYQRWLFYKYFLKSLYLSSLQVDFWCRICGWGFQAVILFVASIFRFWAGWLCLSCSICFAERWQSSDPITKSFCNEHKSVQPLLILKLMNVTNIRVKLIVIINWVVYKAREGFWRLILTC